MKIVDVKQGSPEWKAVRKGKITGTRLKNVLKADNSSVVDEILAELISDEEEEFFVNAAMQHGVDTEPVARKAYEKKTSNVVEQIGFAIHNELPYLGLSPDGLIQTNGKYIGGLEIKCPNTATHVKYIRANRIPPEYRAQVINYFLVCQDMQWLHFVSFDDRFDIYPMHIVTITRAELQAEIDVALLKVKDFWENFEKAYSKIVFGKMN